MRAFTIFAAILLVGVESALSLTTIDFERLPNGTVIPDGTLLTNQYLLSQGLRFPNGLLVFHCASEPGNLNDCDQARSGQNVVASQIGFEIDRQEIVVEFTARQRIVSLYINGFNQSGTQWRATLDAFNASNTLIATQTRTFNSGTSWPTQLRVEVASASITRIVVRGGEAPQFTLNWFLIDDLAFEGETTPPVTDTTPPVVSILGPANGATVTGPTIVNITMRATDNSQLQTFDMQLLYVPSGGFIQRFTGGLICGGPSSPVCPATSVEQTRPFTLTLSGQYQITLRAIDAAGNRAIERSSTFTLNLPPPLPQVSAYYVEFNQGIRNDLDNANTTFGTDAHFPIPIIPGKDLVVRYYLLAEGGPRTNYTARLEVNIDNVNGSRFHVDFSPNDGTPSTGIPVDANPTPGSIPGPFSEVFIQHRADLNRTLNFVIPGAFLTNADFMELRLKPTLGVTSSLVQISNMNSKKVSLGLDIIRVSGTGYGGPVSNTTINNAIIPYLKRAYPVSNVYILSNRTFSANRPASGNDCSSLLRILTAAYLFDDVRLSSTLPTTEPIFRRHLAVVANLDSCGGIAYIKPPITFEDVAVAKPFGDIAAHEIGHTIGLVHVSNNHREAGGGGWEPWPYPHGTIGDGADNFGTIVEQLAAPSAGDAGQWRITLVDPCSTPTTAGRFPTCSLPEGQAPHDFMSYGRSNTDLGPLIARWKNWVSDITYKRIFNAIRYLVPPTFSLNPDLGTARLEDPVSVSSAERIEAFIIDGAINKDGSINLSPILRKPVPRDFVEMPLTGPYTLELQDGAGNVLLKRIFGLEKVADTDQQHINLAVRYISKAQTLVIKHEDTILFEKKATANAPTVRILKPNGGEILQKGNYTIRWEGSDRDGDKLRYLVQYSPDNGLKWQGITIVEPGDSTKAELFVEEMIPGNAGIIRVTASDGFNTTTDQSDNVFALGTSGGPSEVAARVKCAAALSDSCPVSIPLTIDMSNTAPAELLGSFSGKVNWNPAHLKYTGNSGLLAGFTGVINTANAAPGEIIFNGTNSAGANGEVQFLKLNFQVIGPVNGTGTLKTQYSAMSAAFSFTNLLPLLKKEDCSYTIQKASGLGDVNGDGLVNSTDALILLSYDVQLTIPPGLLDRINAGVGDVNADGKTNSTDALIILSYDVRITVPFPLGKRFCP